MPCRTALRSGSCLPFGPHTASTSAFIIAAITCSPVPTAIASRPSCTSPASSAIATDTASGSTGVVALSSVLLVVLLHSGPLSLGRLGGRPTPTARQVSGGGPPPQLPRDPGQPPQPRMRLGTNFAGDRQGDIPSMTDRGPIHQRGGWSQLKSHPAGARSSNPPRRRPLPNERRPAPTGGPISGHKRNRSPRRIAHLDGFYEDGAGRKRCGRLPAAARTHAELSTAEG